VTADDPSPTVPLAGGHAFRVIQATREGLPAVILIDGALPRTESAARFPCLATVVLPVLDPNRMGLCDGAEAARLDGIEEAALASLPADSSRFVGHATWNGTRELYAYVADHSTADLLKQAMERLGAAGAELSVEHDPDWSFYDQFPT
jgi:hypothetical protein